MNPTTGPTGSPGEDSDDHEPSDTAETGRAEDATPRPMTRRMLTMCEAAEVLGVSPRWVRRAVASRSLPHVRLGGLVRIETAELDAYIAAHRVVRPGDQGGDRGGRWPRRNGALAAAVPAASPARLGEQAGPAGAAGPTATAGGQPPRRAPDRSRPRRRVASTE